MRKLELVKAIDRVLSALHGGHPRRGAALIQPAYLIQGLEVLVWLREDTLVDAVSDRVDRGDWKLPESKRHRVDSLCGWWLQKDLARGVDILTASVPADAYLPCLDYFAKAYIADHNRDGNKALEYYSLAYPNLAIST